MNNRKLYFCRATRRRVILVELRVGSFILVALRVGSFILVELRVDGRNF